MGGLKKRHEARWRYVGLSLALLAISLIVTPASHGQERALVIYSGRSEALVQPLIDAFTKQTGIEVRVRYGDTAELAATLLEEGDRSPADVYWAQDAGALGALEAYGRLAPLAEELLARIDRRLQSPDGVWVATSGRARVVAFNTRLVNVNELPEDIWGFTDPKWRGRIGWAPTNGSFQAFVTALRLIEGDQRAEEWLRGILENRPRVYRNNTAIVDAVGRGEVHVGFVNHYYLHRFLAEHGEDFPVRNYHTSGDAGAIVNVAGVGILKTSRAKEAAQRFVEFLLSSEAQEYFAKEVYEYPVLLDAEIEINPYVVPLEAIHSPALNLGELKDLEGTLDMLQRVGVL